MRAANAGVGYEGFRSWLKRGLLKQTGTLATVYAPKVEAEVADAKRWRWAAFGYADLCSFRLAKLMLDTGLSWEMVCTVVGDEALWRSHHSGAKDMRYLAVFPKSDEYTFYSVQSLAADLAAEAIRHDWMTLFDLGELRRSVVFRSRAVALRMIAADMASTSHIYARSGPSTLPPSEAAERQLTIRRRAAELEELADAAETGAGSYRQFEAILAGLHGQGKFPDNAAVSAVAFAFSD